VSVVEQVELKTLERAGACAVQVIRVGFLGYGRVGQAVAELARSSDRLLARGVDVRAAAALVLDPSKPRLGGPVHLCTSPDSFFHRRLDVVIEVMGGVHPAYEYVKRALEARIPVITANKSLMAAKGEELRAAALEHGVPLAFDAAVLAGVPFIGALSRRPFIGAPRRITGILNGTSHFLSCALADGRAFDDALADAIDRGYAEPDSSADISGRDAAEKLTILVHLAGCRDLRATGLTRLGIDALSPLDFEAARAIGGVIKPIATASFDSTNPGAWVGPALVDAAHVAASSRGVHNFLELTGDGGPVTFAGPGAGPAVTAATILDDLVEVAFGGPHDESAALRAATTQLDLSQPAAGGWYIRVRGTSLQMEDFAEHLATHRVPAVRIAAIQGALVARTTTASRDVANAALDALHAIGADVLLLPVVEAN